MKRLISIISILIILIFHSISGAGIISNLSIVARKMAVTNCSGTAGNTAESAESVAISGNNMGILYRVTDGCAGGTITSVDVRGRYLGTLSGYNFTVIAYADNSGDIGDLLGYEVSTTAYSNPLITHNVTCSILTPSNTFWLGIVMEGSNCNLNQPAATGPSFKYATLTSYSNPDTTWPTGSDADFSNRSTEVHANY